MASEKERRFKVNLNKDGFVDMQLVPLNSDFDPDSTLLPCFRKSEIQQGYFSETAKRVTRIRITDSHCFTGEAWSLIGQEGEICLKGPRVQAENPEFEYPIPMADARELMEMCGDWLLDKTRYLLNLGEGYYLELDQFHGSLEGLWIVEIETPKGMPDYSGPFPDWVGDEITNDHRYSNYNLAKHKTIPE